mgnify:CR=1 FL=1
MAEEGEDIVETLRERGLTCGKLKNIEKREIKEASQFRALGFMRIAEAQEVSARNIKALRNKVCKLR